MTRDEILAWLLRDADASINGRRCQAAADEINALVGRLDERIGALIVANGDVERLKEFGRINRAEIDSLRSRLDRLVSRIEPRCVKRHPRVAIGLAGGFCGVCSLSRSEAGNIDRNCPLPECSVVEKVALIDRPAPESVRCNNVPCAMDRGHRGPCSSVRPLD